MFNFKKKDKKEIKEKLGENNNIQDCKKYNWLFIYYIFLLVLNIIISPFLVDVEIILGDFGSLSIALFSILGVYGLKWTFIFNIVGIVLTIFNKYFLDINKIYAVITGIITIMSIFILIIL